MIKRKATAVWQGGGKTGNGHLTTQSNVLDQTQYSYKTRFEEGIGTNPEELIAAAHAGCFSMKLSFVLNGAGFEPNQLTTTCTISLENGKIIASHLELEASIDGMDSDTFKPLVEEAKNECPISKLLDTEIEVSYRLI